MHRQSGLSACRGSTKVAVLDTIHGAQVIANKMLELGIEAKALEVYHSQPSLDGFDFIVAPVHLWPGNPAMVAARQRGKRIITHHRAAGELMEPTMPVFEVSGTHSKTTTALLLAKMLSAKRRVVCHTTQGLQLWSMGTGTALKSGLSITPGNMITAVEAAERHSADILIGEVSLGGTGLADFGILTSFSGDYRIAGETIWASTAKLQMASLAKKGFKLVANVDVKIGADFSFGPGSPVWASPDRIYIRGKPIRLEFAESLDFQGYQTAISAAVAASAAFGIDGEEIAESLQDFDGITGRMKMAKWDGLEVYDSSNSGLKVSDVKRAMDLIGGCQLGVVAGEESKTVCEGMDIPGLVSLLKNRRNEIRFLVLVGGRMEKWAYELQAETAPNLTAGFDLARKAGGLDRLLLCVKCFR